MKLYILVYFLLFFYSSFNAQKKIIVKDLETGKKLKYVAVHFICCEQGIYSNESGEILFKNIKGDSVVFKHIGYYDKKIKTSEILNELFLKPRTEILNEIIISNSKPKTKRVGFKNKKKTLSWHVKPETELITLIKFEKEINNAYLKEISIPIGKDAIKQIETNIWRNYYPEFQSVFRLHLYSNNKNSPNKRLLKEPILIKCNNNSEDDIIVNIENENIIFPQEGIFIGIEMITTNNNEAKLPNFLFTKKNVKNIESISLIKDVFYKKSWINLNEFSNLYQINSLSDYNMAIGLTLDIYKK